MSKKLVSVALSVATLVGVVGVTPSAFAQSTSDLQAQIAALLAQIQTLQGQLGTGGTPSTYHFTRDLTVGSKGDDVKALQQFLNGHGAMVSGSGAGSPGNESTYFGTLTKAALAQWQGSNGISPAVGYFGPKTRAFLASMTTGGGTTGGGTTGGGTTGGGTTVPSAGLAVGLASENPAAGTIISGAGRVPVLAVNFTAGNSGAVNLNQVMFHKTGVVSDSSISGAYLVQSGKVVAQYVSLGSGVITFSNVGLTIPAGQTAKLWLALDLASGVSAGNTVAFAMNSASDVSATDASNNAVTASGTFPINGNNMTVSSVTNPALATLSITKSTVGSSVFAGTQGVLVSQWSASVANSAVNLTSIKFRVTGSANKSDLQNVKLYVNGTQVGSTITTLAATGDAYFDLTSSPAKLSTGNSTIQVYADVMGSPSYNFAFQLLNTYDIYAVDTQYNTSLTSTVTNGSGTTVSIQQGQLTVSLASDTPTGNLAKGQSNITFGKFKIYAAGEAVKVKWLGFKLLLTTPTLGWDSQIKNIALTDDAGGQVGTTISSMLTAQTCTDFTQTTATSSAAVNCFGSSGSPINYIIPANTTRVLSLKGDVQTTADFASVTASLTGNTSNLQGLTSAQSNSSGAVTASSLSLATSALTVAANSAVGTQTFTKNTSGAKIGSYSLTASSAEGVSISNVTIQTGQNAETNYQNMRVMIGSNQFGSTYSTLVGTTTYTFSGTPFTVAAGQTQTVDVYADVLSNAVTISGAASTLSSCTGTGLVSNSSVTCGSQAGQAVTIGGVPSLSIGADSATAPTGQLVMGSTGNSLASFRLTETTNVEDVKITDMVVFQRVATSTGSTKSAFGNLTLYDGNTPVGTAGSAAASANLVASSSGAGYNYSFHFATPVVVSKSSSKTLVLKGDVSSFVSGGATDNSTSTFLIGTSTEFATTSSIVTALGNSSNQAATVVLSSPVGNVQTILRSALTVTAAGLGSTSGRAKNSVDDIGTVTFAASNAGSVALNTVILTISGSLPTSTFKTDSVNGPTYDVKLYDAALGTAAQGTATSSVCSSGSTCTFTFSLGSGTNGYVISAGSSKTFTVRVDSLTHTTAGGNGQSVTLGANINTAAGVAYTDAIDGSGVTANVPATVVPLVVNSVSYAQGT